MTYFDISDRIISKINYYSQDSEPDVPNRTVAFWEDTANNRYWLIYNANETQYKTAFENILGELQWTPIWIEQRAHITQFYKPGTNYPAPSEIGITPVLLFAPGTDEWVFYEWEIPETYYIGSDFRLRFYWAPTDTNIGNVVWGTEYTVATITQTVIDATERLANELLKTDFIIISGLQTQPGDIISIRIFRDADNSLDDYTADAALIHLGLYFQIGKNGTASP